MLKITAPFREKEEVISLIEAGADELYCGYLSPEWVKRYASLEFERKGGGSNFTDLEELKQSVDFAHKKNTPVFLALNGLYVNSQYPLLLKIINQLEKIDFDAFIVADIGLVLKLREKKTKKRIHISTGGTVFNSESARLYNNLGACRVVLDRQTTIESMHELSNDNPDIYFEVFILNTLCVYIDGFCTFLHTYGKENAPSISKAGWQGEEKLHLLTTYDHRAVCDPCCIRYSVKVFQPGHKEIKDRNIRPAFFKQLIDGPECGACAIYDIMQTKIKSVKIVGRQLSPGIRLQSTKFLRSCLGILEKDKNIDRQDYIHRTQELYRATFNYKKKCKGNNCYHPEVLYHS